MVRFFFLGGGIDMKIVKMMQVNGEEEMLEDG